MIIILFAVIPFILCFAAAYLIFRLTMAGHRWVRALPFLIWAGATTFVGVGRYLIWNSSVSPVTQLLLVPGLPALFSLLGLLAGVWLFRRMWRPRVISNDK